MLVAVEFAKERVRDQVSTCRQRRNVPEECS